MMDEFTARLLAETEAGPVFLHRVCKICGKIDKIQVSRPELDRLGREEITGYCEVHGESETDE